MFQLLPIICFNYFDLFSTTPTDEFTFTTFFSVGGKRKEGAAVKFGNNTGMPNQQAANGRTEALRDFWSTRHDLSLEPPEDLVRLDQEAQVRLGHFLALFPTLQF